MGFVMCMGTKENMEALIMWKILFLVEVANKREVQQARELAEIYRAKFKKGKPHGKPGEYRYTCFIDPEPFGGRDRLRDLMARKIPGAKVKQPVYDEFEVI